jgi:hypothetical protein
VSPLALVDSQVQLDTGAYAKTQDQFLDALTPDPAAGEWKSWFDRLCAEAAPK